MKSLRLFAVAVLCVIGAGCLFGQDDPLSWVNAARHAARLPGVSADTLLSDTAARWAARLAGSGILTHHGDDGSTALDRYRAMGGTDVRVGEILGAGPRAGLIEKAWMASPEHRSVALWPGWTHAGWGAAPDGRSLVLVMMFTQRMVEDLSITQGADGLRVSGRFLSEHAQAGFLYNGLDEVQPVEWDPARGAFRFFVPAEAQEGYLRLGYQSAEGGFTLTNAWRGTTPSRPGR